MKPKLLIPDKLQCLYEDYWRYIILRGGRGGSKSHGVATAQLIRGRKRPMLFLDTREIQRSITDSVYSLLENKIHELGLKDFYDVLKTEIRGQNGTKFIFAGLHNNVDNIKSVEDVDECWVEEGQKVTANSWTKLVPSIRKEISPCCFQKLEMGDENGKPCKKCGNIVPLDKIIPSRIVVSYNPELEEDPTEQIFYINRKRNSKVVDINYTDNPFFPNVLREEMLDDKENLSEEMFNHIWLGKCLSSIPGAVFEDEMAKITADGRITDVPYNERYPVHTFWDLGHSDQTCIWFIQIVGFQYHIIDYYENFGKKMPHYIKEIQNKEYIYGTHFLPHDADHEQLGQEATVAEQAEEALGSVEVVPRVRLKAHAISQASLALALSVFDREKTSEGITHLKKHSYIISDDGEKRSKEPKHDIHSHCADAYETFGTALAEHMVTSTQNIPQVPGYINQHEQNTVRRDGPRLG